MEEWNGYDLPGATTNITEPFSANADDRTLHELYLWPWYDAVHDGMAAVMCSYNQVGHACIPRNERRGLITHADQQHTVVSEQPSSQRYTKGRARFSGFVHTFETRLGLC